MIPARYSKLIEAMSQAYEELSGLSLPNDPVNLVDIAARIDAFKKKTEKLCEQYKDRLWEGHTEGIILQGDFYECNLTFYERMHFDQARLKVERPGVYRRYLHSTLASRTTFKPRG